MNQSKTITDGALLTVIYIILLFIAVFLPITQLFMLFVLPVPFVIYTGKYGWKYGIVMFIVAMALSFIFTTVISLPLTLMAGIGGMALGLGLFNKRRPYEIWAQGTIGFIIGIVAVLAFLQLFLSISIFDELNQLIEDSIGMLQAMIAQMPEDVQMGDQLKMMEEQMKSFTNLIPASVAIMATALAFLGQWCSYKVMNRIERTKYAFPPFKHLNFPIALIWIFFFTILLTFFDLDPDGMMNLFVVNASALISALLVIQGYSFIFFYTDHKKLHPSVPIVIVVVTIIFSFIFMMIVEILGIIDLGFSLKQRIREKKD